MNPSYPLVAQRAGHCCEYCHAPEAIFNFPFEVEHIIPTSRQGSGEGESNLALACRSCNLHKGNHLTGEDEMTRSEQRLYHPRLDHWEEHFRVDQKSGAIQGLTPIGRATVVCFRMNNSVQIRARQLWMRLGIFP